MTMSGSEQQSSTPIDVTPQCSTVKGDAQQPLSKTERRRIARKKKKEKLAALKKSNNKKAKKKPKMTNEERRIKYTKLAHDRQNAKRNKFLTCFNCRKVGHAAVDCPNASEKGNSSRICFKCGSTEHRLANCPKMKNKSSYMEESLPYATCFICKEKGHLAGQCEKNQNGLYVNGGGCKFCGRKDHFFYNCTKQKKIDRDDDEEEGEAVACEFVEEITENNDIQSTAMNDAASKKKKRGKIVSF